MPEIEFEVIKHHDTAKVVFWDREPKEYLGAVALWIKIVENMNLSYQYNNNPMHTNYQPYIVTFIVLYVVCLACFLPFVPTS